MTGGTSGRRALAIGLCSTFLVFDATAAEPRGAGSAARPPSAEETAATEAYLAAERERERTAAWNELVARALDDFRASRFERALAGFDQALASADVGTDRPTLAFNAAVCAFALERFSEAERRFVEVAAMGGDAQPLALLNAGFSALRAGRADRAASYLAEAGPGDATVERRRQELAAELEQEREGEVRRALAAMLDAGFDALVAGDAKRARRSFTSALAYTSIATPAQSSDMHYGLGIAAHLERDFQGASLELARSVELDPRSAEGYAALGDAYAALGDANAAEWAYERALALGLPARRRAGVERSLERLFPVPGTGPSLWLSLSAGYDDNAAQSGASELLDGSTASAGSTGSPFLAARTEIEMALRASRRVVPAPYYAGDWMGLTNTTVQELSLQAHEAGARLYIAPSPRTPLRFGAAGAYVLSGLEAPTPFSAELLLAARLDQREAGSALSWRFELGARRIWGLSERDYLDGYRFDGAAGPRLRTGPLSLKADLRFRYNRAGTQRIEVPPGAIEGVPDSDMLHYQIPLSYVSPGLDGEAVLEATSRLRVSLGARVEFRRYLEESRIPSVPNSRKRRQDFRLRPRLGGELDLDEEGMFAITLDYAFLLSVSNVAYDPDDPDHDLDYDDRNFTQNVVEIGAQVRY